MGTSTFSKGLLTCVLLPILLTVFWAPLASESKTLSSDSMMKGVHGWRVTPLFTVGGRLPTTDRRNDPHQYQPVGILDGIGAFQLTVNTIRVLVNHELGKSTGYAYVLNNGTELTGARVHDRRRFGSGGNAYGVYNGFPSLTVPSRPMVRQVLNQPASESHVEQLHPPADGQDRHVAVQRVIKQAEF